MTLSPNKKYPSSTLGHVLWLKGNNLKHICTLSLLPARDKARAVALNSRLRPARKTWGDSQGLEPSAIACPPYCADRLTIDIWYASGLWVPGCQAVAPTVCSPVNPDGYIIGQRPPVTSAYLSTSASSLSHQPSTSQASLSQGRWERSVATLLQLFEYGPETVTARLTPLCTA